MWLKVMQCENVHLNDIFGLGFVIAPEESHGNIYSVRGPLLSEKRRMGCFPSWK